MRIRIVGDGLAVSVVGLGCNNFGRKVDEAGTRAVVDAAIDAGITFFDTAEMYSDGRSEEFLGRALAGRRDQVVVASKFGWWKPESDDDLPGGHPDYVRRAIEGSLSRLGTDYIDLYQYHRPDGVTPLEETLGALNELVEAGKVRFIGSSNLSAAQVEEADDASSERGIARFVAAQNRYSWLAREVEDDLVPVCERLGVGLIPYFPLANGLLTGKYRRGEPEPEGARLSGRLEVSDEEWRLIGALEDYAAERGIGLLDVAIAGLAAQPAVCSVIAGATTPEQARANAAAGEWEPARAELEQLRAL